MKNHHLNLLQIVKSTFLILFLFISLSANSQSRFGVKAGMSTVLAKEASIMHSSDGRIYTHQVDFLGQSGSKSVGLYFRHDFEFLFLEVDAMFASTESKYRILDLIDTDPDIIDPPTTGGPGPDEGITYTEKYSNMDLSLVAGYRHKNFDFGVGPVFHRTFSLDSQLSRLDNYSDRRKMIDPGFQFKVGYNWGPLNVGVKYEDFFLDAGNHFQLDNKKLDFDTSLNALKLELAIGF